MSRRIKVTPLDQKFSKLVRSLAGWKCERCGRQFAQSHARGLECSHYFGRAIKSTRFCLDNCDSLCTGCHAYFHSFPHEYYTFKVRKLGEERYKALVERFNTPVKFNNAFKQDVREWMKRKLDEIAA
jgi:hypothetical protein